MEVSDMCAEIGFRVRVGTLVVLLCAGRASFGLVDVVNYDNHPDLEKAKEYDLTIERKRLERADGSFDQELYKSYVARASRELAEKHYLAYLRDVNESFQRAAVYARLGEMFGGTADPHVATSIDRNKARTYFRKALEAEPERIGWPTLQARGFLAVDADSAEARFASYMNYYQWLLSIDEKTLKEKALSTRPRRPAPATEQDETRRRLRARFEAKRPPAMKKSEDMMLGFIRAHSESTARNLIHEALGRMAIDPRTHLRSRDRAIRHLMMLVDRFPGTSVAERAKVELTRTENDPADDVLAVLDNEIDARWRMAFIATASSVDANEPYVLDLVRGRFLLPAGRLHTEETFTYLSQEYGDFLAWDNAFVMPNGGQLAVVHARMPGALNVVRDQWSVGYELPKGVVFPYHLWLTAPSGQKYLLRVAGVKPEGVSFLYRSVTDEEFEAETRAAPVADTKGKGGDK
jgi:tetratricopeptide (TPR) repeat protein